MSSEENYYNYYPAVEGLAEVESSVEDDIDSMIRFN
jgi:hypothetical protein